LSVSQYLEGVTEEKRRIEVNWVQSMAAALAAVTSAVLLSTVGVAGTLIGAALGSLAATIGSAVYAYSIRETKARVETVSVLAASRIGLANARVRDASEDVAVGAPGAEEELERAGEELAEARSALEDDERPRVGWRTVLAGLPWKRITVGATGIFLVAMGLILAFELVTGRAVSTYTGGSGSGQRVSIPGLGSAAPSRTDPQPAPSDGPSSVPSDTGGTTTEPTPGTTPTTSETAVPPQDEAPTTTPTTSPTPTPTLSPSSATTSSPTPSP
jgi:hypothetical protein